MALARWMLDAFGRVRIEKYWVPVGGHQMHCLKAGAGPDLVLLHGLLGTASAWEPIIAALAEESTVYAVDALGIGESERVSGIDSTLKAQADRLVQFMDASGIASADFVATSHGGAVALALAQRYPTRVKRLLLHAPANPFSHLHEPLIRFYLSNLGKWFAHRVPGLPEPMQALALGRMYGDTKQVREGALAKYVGSLRVPGTVEYVLGMLKVWERDMAELEASLHQVRQIPALLLWGDRDRAVSPESGERLRACFAEADLVVLPGIGHLPYEECPELMSQVVNAYLLRKRGKSDGGPKLIHSRRSGG